MFQVSECILITFGPPKTLICLSPTCLLVGAPLFILPGLFRVKTCLGEFADRFDAPRDALVEYAIQRLLPIIKEEKEKHRKRKEILEELSGYIAQGEKLLEKSKKLLGEDDPVYERLRSTMAVNRNAEKNVRSFVQRGEIIEEF